MGLFSKTKSEDRTGIDYDAAAASVTAASVADPELEPQEVAEVEDAAIAGDPNDQLDIRPEWARAAVKGCFWPAAKYIHPAYAITDEKADRAVPEMQRFLQMVADKWLPAAVGRLANRNPELTDVLSALGILYFHQWREVARIIKEEEKARAAAGENAKRVDGSNVTIMPAPEPAEERIVGERLKDGSLVI